MNRKDIKEAKAAGDSNFEILSMVIDDGHEFPDAVFLVSSALGMKPDEVKQMEADYDECC